MRDRWHSAAVLHDVDESARGGHIRVPDVVMNELVMPDALSGPRIHAHEAAREEVVAGAVSTVVVAGCRFDRQVHVAELFVG